MARMGVRMGMLMASLAVYAWAGSARAEELAIQSFNGSGRLVFNTLNSATNYRIEWASSPTGPWTNFVSEALARLDSIPAVDAGSVTCSVPMFYRVVAAVTNGWLALDVAGGLDFGTIAVGATSTRSLTLINRGGGPLTVTGVECTDAFSCDWTGVIPAGYQQVINVTFTPLGAVEYNGKVTIHSDAAGGISEVTVSGRSSGEYLVINLSEGPTANSYPVSYLVAPPGGGWTDDYKTTKLVLRQLPAATNTFMMGSPPDELGRHDNETQHEVTLSRGFYVGVFEITQKQWERVKSNWPSYFTNTVYRDARPVEQVTYEDIRGSSAGAEWPANNNVDATSFLGLLRAKTGLAFDLPTESQWEYACRAGTGTALNTGYNLLDTYNDPNMNLVGRYYYTGGGGTNPRDADTSDGSATVGSYLPNAWGLYDMHGNASEWCLDWYGAYPGSVTDPKGASSGSNRIFRGGDWTFYADDCRSADRNAVLPGYVTINHGLRLALPEGQP